MFSFANGLFAAFFRALAPRRRKGAGELRILCIAGGGLGDTIDLLPLFNALRRFFPHAHLTVACDSAGAPIAEASVGVNDVVVLKHSRSPLMSALKNAGQLQNYDWALAASDGFDRRLALLTRLSNAEVRVGFERGNQSSSTYFTDPLPPPEITEHRIDKVLRLLKPLGMVKVTALSADLSLRVPEKSRAFAAGVLSHPPFSESKHYMLLNLTSAPGLPFREQDFIALIGRLLNSTHFVVGVVAAPVDQGIAFEIASCMGSDRILAVETQEAIDLAALLENASFLITPEDPIAHLAAAVGTPALVLWHGDFFEQRHSRGQRHVFVHPEPGETVIPLERVWTALTPFLGSYQEALQQKLTEILELPPTSDFI